MDRELEKRLCFIACWIIGAFSSIVLVGEALAQETIENRYIQISKKDPRYLESAPGETFIPIGPNISFPRSVTNERELLEYYELYFRKLSENQGNYTRIWLSVPWFEVEHASTGEYDFLIATRIDKILELATKYKIRVKFCLEHFRKINGLPAPFPGSVPFDRPVYDGQISSMESYFSEQEGKGFYLKRVEFLAKRYSDHPYIFGWELWNEMNSVNVDDQILLEWTTEMLKEVKENFPNHLVMQSLGSYDSPTHHNIYRYYSQLEGNDLAQVHRYLDQGGKLPICQAPMDELSRDAVITLKNYSSHKPIILSEVGAVEPNHAGPSKLYTKDTLGILLHDLLFAPFFSGAAAPGQSWHWEYYIDNNNLWWHFNRFAQAIEGFDPIKEKAVPYYDLQSDNLKVYGLEGENISLLWIRDGSNNWKTELVDQKPVEPLVAQKISINTKQIKKVSFYDPWCGSWSTGVANHQGIVTLPKFKRSIIVKLENIEVK